MDLLFCTEEIPGDAAGRAVLLGPELLFKKLSSGAEFGEGVEVVSGPLTLPHIPAVAAEGMAPFLELQVNCGIEAARKLAGRDPKSFYLPGGGCSDRLVPLLLRQRVEQIMLPQEPEAGADSVEVSTVDVLDAMGLRNTEPVERDAERAGAVQACSRRAFEFFEGTVRGNLPAQVKRLVEAKIKELRAQEGGDPIARAMLLSSLERDEIEIDFELTEDFGFTGEGDDDLAKTFLALVHTVLMLQSDLDPYFDRYHPVAERMLEELRTGGYRETSFQAWLDESAPRLPLPGVREVMNAFTGRLDIRSVKLR